MIENYFDEALVDKAEQEQIRLSMIIDFYMDIYMKDLKRTGGMREYFRFEEF